MLADHAATIYLKRLHPVELNRIAIAGANRIAFSGFEPAGDGQCESAIPRVYRAARSVRDKKAAPADRNVGLVAGSDDGPLSIVGPGPLDYRQCGQRTLL